jgi:uncharacterized protein YuzE
VLLTGFDYDSSADVLYANFRPAVADDSEMKEDDTIVCRETSGATDYEAKRKYTCPIGPEYSRLSIDPDLKLLEQI